MVTTRAQAQGTVEDKPLRAEPANAQSTPHLEKELAFYLSYHSNKINQIIHFFFIPQILWSALLMLAHVSLPLGFKTFDLAPGLTVSPSLATVIAVGYAAYYVSMDIFVGGTYLPIMAAMYLTATYLAVHVPAFLPWRYAFGAVASAMPFALAVHINGWFWQFLGHFKFEGRAPALTESFVQAVVTAPFFVHIEALFALFHWNPELHKRITNLAGKRIVAMNRAKRGEKKAE